MTTAVEQAILEISAALLAEAPVLEGFEDLYRTLTQADGSPIYDVTRAAITNYQRRISDLKEANNYLVKLMSDNYPLPPKAEYPRDQAVIARAQGATIAAALAAITTPGEAASADIDLGSVTPV